MRAGTGNETSDRGRAKKTRSGGSYEIERTKLKISTMTSIGDSTSATQHSIVFVLRESFGSLVQICALVHFHNFQHVLPILDHLARLSIQPSKVLCNPLAAAMISFRSGVNKGMNVCHDFFSYWCR